MTAQVPDKFIYQGTEYALIGIKGGNLFSPEQYGMEPVMIHTACYRGFYVTYELTQESLYLRELTLREKSGNYLPIDGIMPVKEEYQASYHHLNVVVPFTGKIRLAKDFIKELYIHMGYPKPTAFKTVLDATLVDGLLVDINDRSKEMKEKRGGFKKYYENGITIEKIKEAFSLDLDLE